MTDATLAIAWCNGYQIYLERGVVVPSIVSGAGEAERGTEAATTSELRPPNRSMMLGEERKAARQK